MEQINSIRCQLKRRLGQRVNVKASHGRKRYSFHEGTICGVYPNVFTLSVTEDGVERKYSYSYSDVLTKNVQFLP